MQSGPPESPLRPVALRWLRSQPAPAGPSSELLSARGVPGPAPGLGVSEDALLSPELARLLNSLPTELKLRVTLLRICPLSLSPPARRNPEGERRLAVPAATPGVWSPASPPDRLWPAEPPTRANTSGSRPLDPRLPGPQLHHACFPHGRAATVLGADGGRCLAGRSPARPEPSRRSAPAARVPARNRRGAAVALGGLGRPVPRQPARRPASPTFRGEQLTGVLLANGERRLRGG